MNQNIKTALIIGGVVVAIIIILPLVSGLISGSQHGGWGMGSGMMGPWMMGGFGWMWLMPIFWILILGLIIWAVVALVRGLSEPKSSDSSRGNSALEILKRRYAEGEISKEEYEQKKRDLA